MTRVFPVNTVRAAFPALSLTDNGRRRIYFDNPAGTQMPQVVIDRMVKAMTEENANLGGFFSTTLAAQRLVDDAHRAAADFYNAPSPDDIMFGQNMTTITLNVSRALARTFKEGDEIVLSRMDHEGNVAPWLWVAEDRGMNVRWLDFDPETFEFADDALDKVLTDKTRLVAVGAASNCTGTINDVKAICAKARAAGALSYVDAVQLAPHRLLDVQDMGCDFLVSSAYKFFGPHLGLMYARREVVEDLFAYQVRPAQAAMPDKFETGTSPRELLAGTMAAIDYLADMGGKGTIEDRRARLTTGMEVLEAYEQHLTKRLIAGLQQMKGVKIHGLTSPNAAHRRVPTVSITVDGHPPEAMVKALAQKSMFVWSGHNYAVEPVERLGLMETGGVLRIGLAHYNTEAEVDAFLDALEGAVG